jgi:hypothetical protein
LAVSSQNEIWPLVRQLSDALDGNRDRNERILSELQESLRALPEEFRDLIRRQMILIVAGLSRLEVRLIDAHGPLNTAV